MIRRGLSWLLSDLCHGSGVYAPLARWLDRWAIRGACGTVHDGFAKAGQGAKVKEILADPSFFKSNEKEAPVLEMLPTGNFHFRSQMPSGFPEIDNVYGHLTKSSSGNGKHAVILVHGWNGEMQYWKLFPYLAGKLANLDCTVVRFELPFHAQRKPRDPQVSRNFISDDLVNMLLATRQSLEDIRSIKSWLQKGGCDRVSLWGFSLGSWLTGLLACIDPDLYRVVLTTPITRLDRVIEQTEFCAPIRKGLMGDPIDLSSLNLTPQRPLISPENILLMESLYDLFSPPDTVEELWHSWNQPVIWRLKEGHISILLRLNQLKAATRWITKV